MENYYGKKYKMKSAENFDEYLQFAGIGLVTRKLVATMSPVCVVTKNDDRTYSIINDTPIRKVVSTFKLGEEFSEESPDGMKLKATVTMEGNKIIQIHVGDNGKKSTHVREYNGKVLTVTTTCDGWDKTCVRTYELVE